MDTVCRYCGKTFQSTSSLEDHIIGFNENEQLNCKGALKTNIVKIIKSKTDKEIDAIYSLLKLSNINNHDLQKH